MVRKIYSETFCERARELGERNFAVTEASEEMGISPSTFATWEKKYPEFKSAAAKIRATSEHWKKARLDRLLQRTEEELLWALQRIRAKRAKARESL